MFRISSGDGLRSHTGTAAHRILSPACLNELEIFISSDTLTPSLLPYGLYLYCFLLKTHAPSSLYTRPHNFLCCLARYYLLSIFQDRRLS